MEDGRHLVRGVGWHSTWHDSKPHPVHHIGFATVPSIHKHIMRCVATHRRWPLDPLCVRPLVLHAQQRLVHASTRVRCRRTWQVVFTPAVADILQRDSRAPVVQTNEDAFDEISLRACVFAVAADKATVCVVGEIDGHRFGQERKEGLPRGFEDSSEGLIASSDGLVLKGDLVATDDPRGLRARSHRLADKLVVAATQAAKLQTTIDACLEGLRAQMSLAKSDRLAVGEVNYNLALHDPAWATCSHELVSELLALLFGENCRAGDGVVLLDSQRRAARELPTFGDVVDGVVCLDLRYNAQPAEIIDFLLLVILGLLPFDGDGLTLSQAFDGRVDVAGRRNSQAGVPEGVNQVLVADNEGRVAKLDARCYSTQGPKKEESFCCAAVWLEYFSPVCTSAVELALTVAGAMTIWRRFSLMVERDEGDLRTPASGHNE
ncbi:hypothetical protein BDZ90DRAFT_64721 [Jaminaea rosea]|uniref:Uncharacterized protein n=1 Tax=Jaminaea rosea TaxID=1569628 RepID=A0A316UKL8_9BASI|nr:hypothetical protein BDZ90DRAFT_64721 [Jaminaea rosea]PWN25842.1 hypothetical protein BDZ90DRAFT_64721 [Jaminaea rosea]